MGLRSSDATYAVVKQYAEADGRSMNSWIEAQLDAEDMRRRCAAHVRSARLMREWRVLYVVDDEEPTVTVRSIAHRRDAYRSR